MQRRRWLHAGTAAALGAVGTWASGCAQVQQPFQVPESEAQAEVQSLHQLAQRSGRSFGFAIDPSYMHAQRVKPLLRHAGVLTAENAMKWLATQPGIDRWDFSRAQQVLAQARSQRARLRGHALGWHQSLPAWLSQTDAAAFRSAQTRHLQTLARQFAGQVDTWDVLNEVIEPDHKRTDGLRESVLSKLWGVERYGEFFMLAREADPQARLAYNDYGLEQDETWQERRRVATLRLLEAWVKQGVPLDVLGVQSHLNVSAKFSARKLSDFLDAVQALGLTIQITELDVRDVQHTGSVAQRDADVAAMYKAFADVCLSHPAVEMIVMWNVTDADSWFNQWSQAPKRADGQRARPTLFDEQGQAKPAFAALQKSFETATTPFKPKEKKRV
jgi:endo-1,4-beta-xylanase